MIDIISIPLCGICSRPLDQESDPLSGDCGGDCWGCIGDIEAKDGYQPSIEQYNQEVDAGFRVGPKLPVEESQNGH